MAEQIVIPVGVDDGNATTDVVTVIDGRIVQVKIPTRFKSGYTFGESLAGEHGDGGYRVNGAAYTVDEAITDHDDPRRDGYYVSDENLAVVHHAMRKICNDQGQPDYLCGKKVAVMTGLPINRYYNYDGTRNAAAIEAKKKNLLRPIEYMDGCESIQIVEHSVMPEGFAGWFDFVVDFDGKLVKGVKVGDKEMAVDSKSMMAVVDFGGRTLDTAVMLEGQRVDSKLSGTLEVGVLSVIDTLRGMLESEYAGSRFAQRFVEGVLMSGTARMRGEEIDKTALVREAIRTVMRAVTNEIERRVRPYSVSMDWVIFIGGGAALIKKYFSEDEVVQMFDRKVFIPEAPEFANARGMYKHQLVTMSRGA